MLVSNEVIPARNAILRHNLARWGCANVVVTQDDPSHFDKLGGYFDVVIVDAPCSGEGLFRKDEEAIRQWSPELVKMCSRRQTLILHHACNALREGGYLLYSTCTYEDEENDMQVRKLLEGNRMANVPIDFHDQHIVPTEYGKMFFPHRVKGEGFYMAMLRKEETGRSNRSVAGLRPDWKYEHLLKEYLVSPERFSPVRKGSALFALPPNLFSALPELGNLHIRQCGIEIGELKGERLVLSAALALSLHLRPDYPGRDLENAQAIQFLRGNARFSRTRLVPCALQGFCSRMAEACRKPEQ
jgi:hypothetical protein